MTNAPKFDNTLKYPTLPATVPTTNGLPDFSKMGDSFDEKVGLIKDETTVSFSAPTRVECRSEMEKTTIYLLDTPHCPPKSRFTLPLVVVASIALSLGAACRVVTMQARTEAALTKFVDASAVDAGIK